MYIKVITAGFLSLALGLGFSYSLKVIYDRIIPNSLNNELKLLMCLLGGNLLIYSLIGIYKSKLSLNLSQMVDHYLFQKVHKKLNSLGYEFYQHVSHGEIKMLMNDVLKWRF